MSEDEFDDLDEAALELPPGAHRVHYAGRGRVGQAGKALADVEYDIDILFLPGEVPSLGGEISVTAGERQLDGLRPPLRLQLEDESHCSFVIVATDYPISDDDAAAALPSSFEIRAAPAQSGARNILLRPPE